MVIESKRKINGLILAGGHSRRMKKDKSALIYQNNTQINNTFELLKPFCDEIFVSMRKDQKGEEHLKDFSPLFDEEEYRDIGPIAGIVSALRSKKSAWLVVAVDLPELDHHTLEKLITKRDLSKWVSAYESAHDQLPEPLCSIYEIASIEPLVKFVESDNRCPRKFLIANSVHVQLLSLDNKNALNNINTEQEYEQFGK